MTIIISAPNCILKFTQNQVKIIRQNPAPHQLQVHQIRRAREIQIQVKTRLLLIKKLAMCLWKRNRTKWPKTKRKHWKDSEESPILITNNIFMSELLFPGLLFSTDACTIIIWSFFWRIIFLSLLFKCCSRFCSLEMLRKIG